VRGLGSDRIAVLEQHYELGVRLVQASIGGPSFDYEPVERLLAWRDSKL